MKHFKRRKLIGLAAASFLALFGCGKSDFDGVAMQSRAEQLREAQIFQYPLKGYFPEIPVTEQVPPKGERYHAAEDCFAPAGTPVYAIGDGVIRFSGKKHGYGGLIIIDHPAQDVYSLYGHLSIKNFKKPLGEVKKGELIAYIGEAEECYTMLSHIHFGIREGQLADYPNWGNQRWMAGYTNCQPDQVGWFHPSEIIGETESMKEWKRMIQKREDIPIERNLQANDFKISAGRHNEKENLDQVIRLEFGDNYRLADWTEVLPFSQVIEEWADSVGLVEGEENGLLVSNEGYKIWLGRQYYISRFDQGKPQHFLAHDAVDDDLVCLGSWKGINKHVLAVRK